MAFVRLQKAGGQPVTVFWLGVAVFVALALIGASGGVRGSDQYWYLGDLETLLKQAPRFTNTLFPRELLRHGVEHAPFIHNILPQYAPLPLAYVLGPYWGWIATNIVAMVLAAYVTRRAVLLTVDSWLATFLGLLVLLLPLSVWHGFQVLAEPMLMPLFALAVLLVERPKSLLGWGGLAVVLVLGFMSRFTGLGLLLACPVLVLIAPQPLNRRVLGSLLVVAIAVLGVMLKGYLFGGPATEGESAVATGIVTRGMSAWYYSGPLQLTVGAIGEKILYSLGAMTRGGVAGQFMQALNAVLLFAAAGGVAVAVRRRAFVFALFVLCVIALNLATILLYNNQVRYIVPSYPVLLVASGYLIGCLQKRLPRLCAVAGPLVLVGLVALAVPIVLKGRNDGLKEQGERAQIAALSKTLQGPGDIVSLGLDSQMLAYIVNPRYVLYTKPSQTDADWDRILAMPRWRWVLSRPQTIERLTGRGVEMKLIQRFEFRGANYGVYELEHPG